jgi:hypothetical protein
MVPLSRFAPLVGLGLVLLASGIPAPSQGPAPARPSAGKLTPKLEPIAETKLLMEGLAHPNFRSLDRLLQTKPAEDQAWKFARGQALLLAETANLLMLRPPRNQGQTVWFERAMELRDVSTKLAHTLAKRDYDDSRGKFVAVANACNRCHQTFRIQVEIAPFAEKPEQPMRNAPKIIPSSANNIQSPRFLDNPSDVP